MHEARIQTGTGVDQYGDPDLMADFAKEYLKQHWVLLQPGRLPQTLVEVMPSRNTVAGHRSRAGNEGLRTALEW